MRKVINDVDAEKLKIDLMSVHKISSVRLVGNTFTQRRQFSY